MKQRASAPPMKLPASSPAWQPACALLWLALFLLFFYSFTLPNSNPPTSRLDVWSILHFILLENVDPLPVEHPVPSGWGYFPQRIGFLLLAGYLLAGCWAIGRLLLRGLKLTEIARLLEGQVLAVSAGLIGWSLITLGLGSAGITSRALFLLLPALLLIAEFVLSRRGKIGAAEPSRKPTKTSAKSAAHEPTSDATRDSQRTTIVLCAVLIPFLLCIVLGSVLPSTDFDVKEYHLQGPKEFFQQGQITFLPHNVYTSFPFLTEMLTLSAMIGWGDWYWGALAGKALLMLFAPLTALALYAAGRRWFGHQAGLWGAVFLLTTPWIYRMSIIAYAEGGLAHFLFATLLAVMLTIDHLHDEQTGRRLALLSGFLAGGAMSCKYPGVISVVIPLFVAVTVAAWRAAEKERRLRSVLFVGGLFTLGTFVSVGPWLLKNLIETGNPFYPLLYTIFGGVDWDAAMNAKWKAGHSPSTYAIGDLGEKFIDVIAKSDWQSPLLFGFAPLAWFAARRKQIGWLWLYVGYLFLTWWVLTHRIDRFWIPMIPAVAFLAGVGMEAFREVWWQIGAYAVVAIALVFNLGFITTGLCGYNAYLVDLDYAANFTGMMTSPEVMLINQRKLPPEARVLCVGDAELFDARFNYVYNTVFDRSIFQQWCGVDDPSLPAGELPLRDPTEISTTLRENGIALVYVNWAEILRYRLTYGYTDFVTPRRLIDLQQAGVLAESWPISQSLREFDTLSKSEQREVETWGPELKVVLDGKTYVITAQIYPVRPASP